jgi:ubiquinone/menaquinone biosynthesis C-methylase UbiE
MKESYVSDEEYPGYLATLNGLRGRIAEDLPIKSGMKVLDLACGYGFFAIAVAERYADVSIVGIDLTQSDVDNAVARVAKHGFSERVRFLQMDGTELVFPNDSFDCVVNFLGLEDIYMTRGRDGVARTFSEVYQVLRPGGSFSFAVMPPQEMETEAQRLEVAVFDYVCGCKWLSVSEYTRLLKDCGFTTPTLSSYRTSKKLTTKQAREEIKFACGNVPATFGIPSASFDDVWSKFGPSVEKQGLGHYSKVVVFISKKK